MFKEGQRIRCIEGCGRLKQGEVYTAACDAKNAYGGHMVTLKELPADNWRTDRFELIPEGDENRPCPVEGRKASETQVGGDHYLNLAIQPIEFITKNELTFIEGNIVKYVCRHRTKAGDGAVAVRKIIHYARLLLELEYGEKE